MRCYTLCALSEITMPRAHHPVAKAAAPERYLPLIADPLNPLAEEVGKAVAQEVKDFGRRVTKAAKKTADPGVLGNASVAELQARITVLVAKVLGRSLSSPTAKGKALRMALIAKLASDEIGGAEANVVGVKATDVINDALLTTAEAAVKLEVSRPYVSMLCDAGKLGEIVMTEGGHRRIRSSAVDAYLAARTKQHQGAKSPREAGVEAGLYDYPEGYFKNVVRESGAVKPAKKAARRLRS
jgi:excisionase family DNA binding protein